MNRYSVMITAQAEEQIREIAYHIAVNLNAPDAAENLIDELYETFDQLGTNPERQFLVDEEPWRSKGVRKILVKHYLVYFWINAENATVQVTGVCYEKRDQIKFLKQIILE